MLQERTASRMTVETRRKFSRPSGNCGDTYIVENKSKFRPYGWGSGLATGALATYELMEKMGMPDGYMKYGVFGLSMLFGGGVGAYVAGKIEKGMSYVSNRLKGNQKDELVREEERIREQERNQYI